MPNAQALPLLLSFLIGSVMAFIAWGLVREQEHLVGSPLSSMRDEILLGLLALAAFASGVFATIILLTLLR